MGADEAVLVSDPLLEDAGAEATALALSRAIAALEDVDLVLTGRQAADWDAGVVGCGVAELLDWPVITFARKVEINERAARVERVLTDGFESIEADLPAVVTVSNELGAARAPSLRETMRAARKPLSLRSASAIGLAENEIAAMNARRVRTSPYVPVNDSVCELVSGVDDAACGAALAHRLREARLV
jgi:electron transfer flavoprotein beta subunit